MKRLSVLLLLVAFLAVNVSAQKTYALLTGVSNYGDEKLKDYFSGGIILLL